MSKLITNAAIAKEALQVLSGLLVFGDSVPDTRKWPRFKAWALRRPAPMVCRIPPMPQYQPGQTIKIARPKRYIVTSVMENN